MSRKAQLPSNGSLLALPQAVCLVDDGPSGMMAISGIGKFPHLSLDATLVSFGEVYTGRSAVKHVTLTNPSLVPANFTVRAAAVPGQARAPRPLWQRGCKD